MDTVDTLRHVASSLDAVVDFFKIFRKNCVSDENNDNEGIEQNKEFLGTRNDTYFVSVTGRDSVKIAPFFCQCAPCPDTK